ncbi:hypothetical protein D3C73_981850 [compost metagenome]
MIVYSSAPDAMPVESFTAVVPGSLPLARCIASSLPSKLLAKRASGTCRGYSRGSPLMRTSCSPTSRLSMRLKPPTVLRNWVGGLTCHGRIASARVYSCATLSGLLNR